MNNAINLFISINNYGLNILKILAIICMILTIIGAFIWKVFKDRRFIKISGTFFTLFLIWYIIGKHIL